MKKYYTLLLLCLFTVMITNAQSYNLKKQVKEIENKIEQIRKDHKTNLKQKLKAISERLTNKEITVKEANKLKDSLKTASQKQIQKKFDDEFKKITKLNESHAKLKEYAKFHDSKTGKAIKKIIVEEKMDLKKAVQKIDSKLSANEITQKQADSLKTFKAELHANNIEKRVSNEEAKIQKTIQEFTNAQIASTEIDSFLITTYYGKGEKHIFSVYKTTKSRHENWKKSLLEGNKDRTNNQGVIALGVNNVMTNGKLSSDFKTWQSNFIEYGHSWKYRLSKNFSPFYIKYGASLLFNNLKAKENQYFVKPGNQTNLATHTKNLKESRLKNVQLIFPVHFQIDFSKPHYVDGIKTYEYSHRESFRIGLGGYAGFRLLSRQILKYEENGILIKEKSNDNYNLNNFTYGLSAYLGYRSTAFYVKYDLNTLFKNGNGRGVSLGLRLEI